MKKIILVLAFAAIVPAFVGCKKTCTCTTTTTATSSDPDFDPSMVNNTTTSTAQTTGKCSDLNSTTTQSAAWYTVDVVTECK